MSLYGGIELTNRPDLENIRRLDLMPMRSIHEMMQYGMAIDCDWLAELSSVLDREMKELRREICSYVPSEKLDEFIEKSNLDPDEAIDEDSDEMLPMNVDSPVQIRELLFEVLGVGKGHKMKLTNSGDISTGKRQLEQRKKDHPVVQVVLNYRERAKLKGTYADKLPKMARVHPRGECWCGLKHWVETKRVHTEIMTTRTTTGRPASRNPNLQNIPVRSDHGRRLRAGFIATPGTELVTGDFSQLELRILAHTANVPRLIDIFHNDLDPHTMTAMWAFKLDRPEQVDKLTQRPPAKNVNFAICYGETPRGLYDQLLSDTYGKSNIPVPDWLTLGWCEDFMEDKWHALYPEVRPYMENLAYRSRRYGVVWSLFGRVRKIPEVMSVHNRIIAAGDRQAGNMPIQGTGADMLKLAQTEMQDWIEQVVRPQGVWCWMLNTVHDELIVEVEQGYGEIVKNKLEDVMENVVRDRQSGEWLFRVPVKAEAKVMDRWVK